MDIRVDEVAVKTLHEEYRRKTELELDTGRLMFGELPIIWARAEVFFNLLRSVEEMAGDFAYTMMYNVSYPHGQSFYMFMRDLYDERGQPFDRNTFLRDLCSDSPAAGWGRTRIEDGETIKVIADHGFPIGLEYKTAGVLNKLPVDSFFLGYHTGALSAMDKVQYVPEETECVAQGHERCVFTLRRPEE